LKNTEVPAGTNKLIIIRSPLHYAVWCDVRIQPDYTESSQKTTVFDIFIPENLRF